MDGPECKLGGSEIDIIEVEDEDKKSIFPSASKTDTAEILEARRAYSPLHQRLIPP